MVNFIVHDMVVNVIIYHILIQWGLDYINTMCQLFAPCPYLFNFEGWNQDCSWDLEYYRFKKCN